MVLIIFEGGMPLTPILLLSILLVAALLLGLQFRFPRRAFRLFHFWLPTILGFWVVTEIWAYSHFGDPGVDFPAFFWKNREDGILLLLPYALTLLLGVVLGRVERRRARG